MRRDERRLPVVLAHAFAADGPWDDDGLAHRARVALGGAPELLDWLRPFATAFLRTHPFRPDVPVVGDDPDEVTLEFLVATHRAFGEVVRAARARGESLWGRPWQPYRGMSRPRWPVVVLDDVAQAAALLRLDASELAWFADLQGRQRRAPSGRLHHYRYRWVPRPGRVPRLLEAPLPRLATMQRRLLRHVVGPVPAHPAAHAYVPGRGPRTGALPHAGAEVLLTMDLRAFFVHVTRARVRGVLATTGYPPQVAALLAGVLTTATPHAVLRAMPPGGSTAERVALRAALREPHLPQGAPSSPHLANLVAFGLDARLAAYAAAAGARYTRYADDLSFSGPAALAAGRLAAGVAEVVAAEGLAVNRAKTRVRRASQRQVVTGIVVNAGPNVPREEYDRLKALLHNASRHGAAAQNRAGVASFADHVRGRVAWVEHLNPARGARLRALYDAVDWQS